MTDEEKYTFGLYLTVILILIFMVALAAARQHPEWFD